MFSWLLEMTLNKTVVDKTGIEGRYDMRIMWTLEKGRSVSSSSVQPAAYDPEPTIFDAIQDQLGLKLVPAKIPTTVLVVDDVQMPEID
jgi:uncharacterized protein (TIGR03435 family)